MINVQDLWGKRRSDYWTMAIRYLRLIANSGFLFTIYLLFVFGSYYYGQFLQWLPEAFPAVLFFTVVFTWLETRGRVRTFMKQGDLFFLTPVEGRLAPYIRSSIFYSWIMETFWLALSFLVLAPLFFDRIQGTGSVLWFSLFLLSALKAYNLLTGFEEQRVLDKYHYLIHTLLRAGLNLVAVYAIFSVQPLWVIAVVTGALLLFYLGYYRRLAQQFSLKWERLVEIENQTVMTFYRIANSFTDVPSLKSKVRFRTWLNAVYSLISFDKKHVYHYLFARSFFRSNDYFGIYIRLTLLGALFLSIVELDWGRWLIAILFAYMTTLQLETLKNHYDTSQMVELYPIDPSMKIKAHSYWMNALGVFQVIVFAVIVFFPYGFLDAVIVLVLALVAYQYHIHVRLPKKYETSSM
ncbi:ABC transporter permease [Salipaludibacillus neizhouensis]|uniref:ABC transporter permease n=1 Tax=Salipaludibacillus neizhouensis TaxID=885475 RepID=A0A3A9KCR0_9BACI|nr:ABC transporter permease [Salipaludibacillus neizhouensis]RKL68540.1 ABC transporter permease [Salipaludibacillus neizhouensis]